jgi:protein-tyrosine-phosphatase
MIKVMKILFLCQANVGRSQAAMELYRQKDGVASSAGTKVDMPGTTLAERPGAVNIVQVMREDYNINMIHNVRTQVTEDVAKGYDKIIIMAEKDTVPEWLFQDKRSVFWTVNDPKGQDVPTTRRIVNEIKQKVDELAQL